MPRTPSSASPAQRSTTFVTVVAWVFIVLIEVMTLAFSFVLGFVFVRIFRHLRSVEVQQAFADPALSSDV